MMFNCMNINLNKEPFIKYQTIYRMCNCMNINSNPVRDYRSVENRYHKASHTVRYATRILQYGCIPYGMQGTFGIQFSTERYIPTECLSNERYIPTECKYNTNCKLETILDD